MGIILGIGAMFTGLLTLITRRKSRQAPSQTASVGYAREHDELNHRDVDREVKRQASVMLSTIRSPFDLVTDAAWKRFVEWCRRGRLGSITPGYRLGRYQIDCRQLEAFGYMKNVRKVQYNGKDVYNGEWLNPYAEYIFLADDALQYEVFLKIIANHFSAIGERYRDVLKLPLNTAENAEDWEKMPVTLSGLLAVAKHAGLSGLGKWLDSSEDRKKFVSTTEAYQEMNGTF